MWGLSLRWQPRLLLGLIPPACHVCARGRWAGGHSPRGFLQVSSVKHASSDGSDTISSGVLYPVLVIAPDKKEPFRCFFEAFKSEGLLRLVTLTTVGGPL